MSEADIQFIQIDEVQDADYPCYLERLAGDDMTELTSLFGETHFVYSLTYVSPYSRDNAYMTLYSSYDSYKVFSADDINADKSDDDDFWLKYTGGVVENKSGIVDMYIEKNLPVSAPSVGYVVFYAADNSVLAIIKCISPFEQEVCNIDNNSLVFASGASSQTINVESNVDWTVTYDADWLNVTPVAGSRDGEIIVSVTENIVEEVRNAEIIISSANITHTVTVRQRYGEVLEAEEDEISFGCLTESKKIKITANVEWTVMSDSDWCTVSPDNGTSDANITITVSRNIEDGARTAVLTLKSESESRTITVNQMYDDGSITNGDEAVHFLDWKAAKTSGAILQRLTSGKLYSQYREGNTPVYHLTYSKTTGPLRIVVPSEVVSHNVNPYSLRTNFLVNGIAYDDESLEKLGQVVLDKANSVEVSMSLPDGKNTITGNINFVEADGEGLVLILICTIE